MRPITVHFYPYMLALIILIDAGCGGSQSRSSYCAMTGVICVPEDTSSIGDALRDVSTGDIISVGSGGYRENIVIDKNIQLIGAGSGRTFLIAADPNEDVIEIAAGSTLRDLNISGGKVCVFVDGAGNSEISDSHISDCTTDGIASSSAAGMDIDIVRNEISGTADGLDLRGPATGDVVGNYIHDNSDDGIDINNNVGVFVSSNMIGDNGDDGIEIRLGYATDMVIINNTIVNNGEDGIEIIDSNVDACITTPISCYNKINVLNNTLRMNSRYGLGLVNLSTEEVSPEKLIIGEFR